MSGGGGGGGDDRGRQPSLQIDKMLETVVREKVSDLHITTGQPPVVRVGGRMVRLETKTLTPDDTVGLIMARLKALGIADNTIVIFASDNGVHAEGENDPTFFKSSGPLQGIKRDLTEGGIRVPFIVWGPGRVPAGVVSHHAGYFADFMPTAAQLARTAAPANDGLSFAPLIGAGGAQAPHEAMYWEFYEKGMGQAVRLGDWKGIREPMFTGPLRLYDLKTDLGETRDIAAQNPQVVARINAIMTREHVDDPRWRVGRGGGGG